MDMKEFGINPNTELMKHTIKIKGKIEFDPKDKTKKIRGPKKSPYFFL